MPRAAAMESQRLLDLASWEWQELAPALIQAGLLIQPLRAKQKYQNGVEYYQKMTSNTVLVRKEELSHDEQVASGRAKIMRAVLHHYKTRGLLEVQKIGEVEYFRKVDRRTPVQCPNCSFEITGRTSQPADPLKVVDPQARARELLLGDLEEVNALAASITEQLKSLSED